MQNTALTCHRIGPLGRFGLEVAMYVYMFISGLITLQWSMYTRDVTFIGRGLNYLSVVSVRPVLYHLLSVFIGRCLKYLSPG